MTLLALGLLAVTPPADVSKAVANVYREACVQGQLRLSNGRGSVVGRGDVPEFVVPYASRKRKNTTYVRMKVPRNTYVVIENYRPRRPGDLASICRVVSSEIREEDAFHVLLDGEPDPTVRRTPSVPPFPNPETPFVIDRPTEGYSKVLQFREPWVTLQTTMYKMPQ